MKKIRLGLMGAGVIGRRHIEAMIDTEQAELVAIADPEPSVKALADQHHASYYDNYDALLDDKNELNGVVVATPTENHEHATLAALQAGLHVLVEKPITPTLAAAERIIAAAAVADRHVLVGHHRRYYALTNKARDVIQSGVLGQLVAINGQWTTLKHDDYYLPDWRKKRESGPVLINLIHEIDSLRYLCGEISTLSALLNNSVRQYEKEDTAAVMMRFASGVIGTFVLSDAAPSPWTFELATGENPAFPPSYQNSYRFMGSEAALEYPKLTLWQHKPGERSWHHAMQAEDLNLDLGDAYLQQCQHFCEVIAGDAEPRITAEDATRTLAATLAVFEAANSGRQISL